ETGFRNVFYIFFFLTFQFEERIYQLYNYHIRIIQEKLQGFTQKVAKISHLKTELNQVVLTWVYLLQQSLRLRRGPDHHIPSTWSLPRPSDSEHPDVFISPVTETTSQVVTSQCSPTLWGQTCSLLIFLSLILLQRPA
uniref:Uncharacterized protein n=1 Tax=Theropithecus gelada TaxID=9565 RepID=A0A8D2JYU1_THEGE